MGDHGLINFSSILEATVTLLEVLKKLGNVEVKTDSRLCYFRSLSGEGKGECRLYLEKDIDVIESCCLTGYEHTVINILVSQGWNPVDTNQQCLGK